MQIYWVCGWASDPRLILNDARDFDNRMPNNHKFTPRHSMPDHNAQFSTVVYRGSYARRLGSVRGQSSGQYCTCDCQRAVLRGIACLEGDPQRAGFWRVWAQTSPARRGVAPSRRRIKDFHSPIRDTCFQGVPKCQEPPVPSLQCHEVAQRANTKSSSSTCKSCRLIIIGFRDYISVQSLR
jgi:hypothetical protein